MPGCQKSSIIGCHSSNKRVTSPDYFPGLIGDGPFLQQPLSCRSHLGRGNGPHFFFLYYYHILISFNLFFSSFYDPFLFRPSSSLDYFFSNCLSSLPLPPKTALAGPSLFLQTTNTLVLPGSFFLPFYLLIYLYQFNSG